MRSVDLRSDTTTLPSDEMRQAIAGSELGDDVFKGDPTINKLQDLSAQRMGKEAALLVPSGTMAISHTDPQRPSTPYFLPSS